MHLMQIHGGGWVSGNKADVVIWSMPCIEKGWNVVNLSIELVITQHLMR